MGFSDYDAFARVYDRQWGPGTLKTLPLVREQVLSSLPPGARILDLCCGTGQLAHALTVEGFIVVGVDGSPEQLARARANAPAAEFVQADARSFELPGAFDAVLSLSDSLNHILSAAELTTVFRSVHAALRPDGLFFFDLNMEHKYRKSWAGTFATFEADTVGAFRTAVSLEDKRASFDAALFDLQPDGAWKRSDVHLLQTWYGEAEVRTMLTHAGFAGVTTHQPHGPDKMWFAAR
jgi:SAM-dependent methyltransferase